MKPDLVKQPWVSLTMLALAITAIGLSLAALIIALDDDGPSAIDNGGGLASLVTAAPAAETDTDTPTETEARATAPATPAPLPPVSQLVAQAATEALADAADLLNGRRPLLGIIARPAGAGVRVGAVLPGSPAADAGVQEGDEIRTINGAPVASLPDLHDALRDLEAGDTVQIGLDRDGQSLTLNAQLRAFDPGDAFPRPQLRDPAPRLGLHLRPADQGLTVTAVAPGSGAQTAGIAEGDILRALNGTPIDDLAALRDALADLAPGDTVSLTVQRNGASLDLAVVLGEATARHPFPGFARPDPNPSDGGERRGPFGRFGLPFPDFGRFFEQGGFFGEGSFLDAGGLFAEGEIRVLIGEITAITDSSVQINDGDLIPTNDDTRRAGTLQTGDRALVLERDGVARLILPAPRFPRTAPPPTDA